MIVSIYHFFSQLAKKKSKFKQVENLAEFPFPSIMLSCQNNGIFPDMALKISEPNFLYQGGELIELKDSIKNYGVASFNSTIPTGKKNIAELGLAEHSTMRSQMERAGNHIESVEVRDVYYLVRGKKRGNVKVCLVHGSFFETVSKKDLINGSFSKVLDERLEQMNIDLPEDQKQQLYSLFSDQSSFSRVRDVEKSSVKLRFRIMTEVKAEGNILSSTEYPEIQDNTLNLMVPCHSDKEMNEIDGLFNGAIDPSIKGNVQILKIKHHLNGFFRVFQIKL